MRQGPVEQTAVAMFLFILFILLWSLATSAPAQTRSLRASVSNRQVYLEWDTGYRDEYRVLRSTVSGGYYSAIVEHLTDPKWVDTPSPQARYFYVVEKVDRENGNVDARTNEEMVIVD